jgi:hypothetical protein
LYCKPHRRASKFQNGADNNSRREFAMSLPAFNSSDAAPQPLAKALTGIAGLDQITLGGLPPEHLGIPMLAKPYRLDELAHAAIAADGLVVAGVSPGSVRQRTQGANTRWEKATAGDGRAFDVVGVGFV